MLNSSVSGCEALGQSIRICFMQLMCVALCVLASGPLLASSGQATDDAFAALLSMPGAGPEEGSWNFPVPEDFTPGKESALIAYLGTKQKAGADLNAYRHLGTLLHHAIRAGQTKTAIWLLEHGADPRKPLLDSKDDALALSVRYKRGALSRLLQDKYALVATVSVVPLVTAKAAPDIANLKLSFVTEADYALAREALSRTMWGGWSPGDERAAKRAREAVQNWEAFVVRMPSGAYVKVMDDDKALADLIRLYSGSDASLDKAFSGLPPDLVKRHGKSAIAALVERSGLSVSSGKNPKRTYHTPVAAWRTLWRYLDKPIDYTDWPGIAGKLSPELWPEMFANGYTDHRTESALGCMLAEIGGKDMKSLWPSLSTYFTDIRQAAPSIVLSHYRLVANPSSYCWSWEADETRDKLLFLSSLGIKTSVKGIIKKELEYVHPDLLAAMKPFMPSGVQVGKPRLVEVKPGCKFTLTDAWYEALLNDAVVKRMGEDPGQIFIDTVQLIEIPGELECGLIVGGEQPYGGYPHQVLDSFTGPMEEPFPSCPDPNDRYEIWHRGAAGGIERLETDLGGDRGDSLLIPVQDRTTGKRYYFNSGTQYGQCYGRQRLPLVFAWQQTDKGWALLRSTAFEQVLFDQCRADGDEGVQCQGVTQQDPASGSEPKQQDAFGSVGLQAFLKGFGMKQFSAYQAAILTLDKPKLKTLQAKGISGAWTAEAIKQVGASDLSIAEKRKRTAWIFLDRAQLQRTLSSDTLEGLLPWLPREDWGPIFDVVQKNRGAYYGLEYLRQHAEEKGLNGLACDIDHARGLICGETIDANR